MEYGNLFFFGKTATKKMGRNESRDGEHVENERRGRGTEERGRERQTTSRQQAMRGKGQTVSESEGERGIGREGGREGGRARERERERTSLYQLPRATDSTNCQTNYIRTGAKTSENKESP